MSKPVKKSMEKVESYEEYEEDFEDYDFDFVDDNIVNKLIINDFWVQSIIHL